MLFSSVRRGRRSTANRSRSRRNRRPNRLGRPHRHPALEPLEERELLSTTNFAGGDIHAYWISGLGGCQAVQGAG